MEISKDLRCVFSGEVEARDGSYVVEIPERELALDTLTEGEVYRVALLARASGERTDGAATDGSSVADSDDARTTDGSGVSASSAGAGTNDGTDAASQTGASTTSAGGSGRSSTGRAPAEPEPPVDRGDEVTVDIEGIGDQGDGIARVDRGYVIIVPDTEKGERVRIRVTSVKQNVAFAEVIERVGRREYE